jgi:hypothetical protein
MGGRTFTQYYSGLRQSSGSITFAVLGWLLGECEECLKVPSSAIETMNVTKLVVGMEASPLY